MRTRSLLPVLVAVTTIATIAVTNASAFGATFAAYTPPVQFCDGTNGTPAHGATQWHPLIATHADGSFWCTYGHDHGGNPEDAEMASRFGSLNVPGGQSISYPWATLSPTNVPENSTPNKHRAYKWITWEYGPTARRCDPTLPGSLGAYDGRIQYHIDGNLNAVSRFHSFYAQIMPIVCGGDLAGGWGQISFGGHLDYPILVTDGNSTYAARVPLSNDPGPECPGPGTNSKNEGSSGAAPQSNGVWYGTAQTAPNRNCQPVLLANETNDAYGFSPHFDVKVNVAITSFGPIDRSNPGNVLMYGSNRAQHDMETVGSDTFEVSLVGFDQYIVNRHIDFDGYTDRHLQVVSGCTGVSIDCVPAHVHTYTDSNWTAGHPVFVHSDLFAGTGGQPAHFDGEAGITPRGYYVSDPVTVPTPSWVVPPIANATASNYVAPHAPIDAWPNAQNEYWNAGSNNGWLVTQFSSPQTFEGYQFTTYDGWAGHPATGTYVLYGSNDGVNWTQLVSQNLALTDAQTTYQLQFSQATYSYVKLTALNPAGGWIPMQNTNLLEP